MNQNAPIISLQFTNPRNLFALAMLLLAFTLTACERQPEKAAPAAGASNSESSNQNTSGGGGGLLGEGG
jgi:hypothetical protein